MKQPVLYLILFLLLAAGCSEDPRPAAGQSPAKAIAGVRDTDGTPGDWYMRMNGLLGDKPVVLNLCKYGTRIGGYYQYGNNGPAIRLQDTEDTALGDNEYYLTEVDRNNAARQAGHHWLLRITAGSATGQWISSDNQRRYALRLQEAYPAGSLPLKAYAHTDSGRAWASMAYPRATVSYGLVWPGVQDKSGGAAFLRAALAQDARLESSAGPLRALRTRAWRYFGNYRLDIKKVLDSTAAEDIRASFSYQYDATFHHYVLYNESGWLIVESSISNYTGGAHGLYGATYQNLDLNGLRTWRLNDVITDTAALRPLLEAAARKQFGLQRGEPLESRMLVRDIPVTPNFYLNAGGLTFVYNPYDIASYADGVIALSVPYSQLTALLTPEFRQRADFEDQSGSL